MMYATENATYSHIYEWLELDDLSHLGKLLMSREFLTPVPG